ncbi:hypothetical protein [Halodesulfovibrio marinisediminis]|uniref:Uncharacterized protein n=1 Tax=Halodesulfovibrio marinisediminis DSM 17456 TaxID=1121457 RepID=A0A1N6HCC9_9BACT|nr:hypothetical protein [Halodesulfovibrio marinisediminis]SIO17432.1 hypothetical protein SAMN02745161_2130 [Halodesulfovibrio marinisediminis DSM 17456]
MDLRVLAELKEYLTVKQHTPGRLKVKVDLAIRNHPKLPQLQNAAKSGSSAIKKTNLNIFTQTLTVDYDVNMLPFESLQELLSCDDPDRIASLATELMESVSV